MIQSSTPSGLTFAVARISIEFTSTFAVGTGRGDSLHDAVCVTDANGLPALPGTSIAGVLRSVMSSEDESYARDLFGYQPTKRGEQASGSASRLEVSWAVVHDAKNRPVAPLRAATDTDDAVLRHLRLGVVRDHVRISERGVADGNGKFDVRSVPAGARFTFELKLNAASKQEAQRELEVIVNRIASGAIRFGARTRRGAGSFEMIEALLGAFDLGVSADRNAWRTTKGSLRERPASLRDFKPKPNGSGSTRLLELPLEPADLWIFGTGKPVEDRDGHFTMAKDKRKPHDKLQVWEQRIVWSNGVGSVSTPKDAPALIAGTSIKGAIRHRTLFHAVRLAKKRPETAADPLSAANAAVDALFGFVSAGGDGGAAVGQLSVTDIYVKDVKEIPMQHVALDRFTQAPMDGFLYSEAPVRSARVTLKFQLSADAAKLPNAGIALPSLELALTDLAAGRLALGSGANRGHGFFRGAPEATASIKNFARVTQ